MEFIGKAFASVTGTAREVVSLLYGFDAPRRTPGEISQLLGLSLDQIDKIATQVLRRMRHPVSARIVREALVSGEELIWRAMAGPDGIVYKAKSLTPARDIMPGELCFAIDCQYGTLENWLSAAGSRETERARYRSPFPEAEIDRLMANLDQFPVPKPIETLAREMQAEPEALATAILLSGSRLLYSGYVTTAPLGARAPRAVRLHRILSGAHSGEMGFQLLPQVVPARRLLAWYRSEFADDDCNVLDIERAMTEYPHLFLWSGDLGWCGIGAPGNRQSPLDAAGGVEATFRRWSETRKSSFAAPDAGMVRRLLEEHGALTLQQIQRLLHKQSNGSIPLNSHASYLTICDQLPQLAPGVYTVEGRSASQLAAARKVLLNRGDCLRYILARWAGEPADAYPLWTPEMEADWCEWAERKASSLIPTLLSVVDPAFWPATDPRRNVWLWKKDCLEYFQHEPPVRYPLAVFPLIDLLAMLKCARWRGEANWAMAYRTAGPKNFDRMAASLMAALVGVGAVLPGAHWQKPHAISPQPACEIDGMLSSELHRKGSLAWDGDAGRSLLDRLAESFDRGETGWVARAEMRRLLELLRDAGGARVENALATYGE